MVSKVEPSRRPLQSTTMRAALVFPIIFIWTLVGFGLLVASLYLAGGSYSSNTLNLSLADSSRNLLEKSSNSSQKQGESVLASVSGTDARTVLINRFLAKHASPMTGMGGEFVAAADRYGIDWRLLPAIAFQESNLGKKVPKGSYNPFGWAIYEGESSGVYFQSWASSIDKVAAKIKENYINNGFDTPETIVAKYTSGNSPSWVFAVNFAMEEIAGLEY